MGMDSLSKGNGHNFAGIFHVLVVKFSIYLNRCVFVMPV